MMLFVSILIGAGLGAALGYFGKCASGACLLTANPWRGAFFGAILGTLFYMSAARRGTGSGSEVTPNVKKISGNEFAQEVEQSAMPVVVDFYATWCGPCKVLSPRLDKVASSMANQVRFVKVDIDQSPQLAERFRIEGVPTLLMFRHGKLVDTVVGLLPEAALKSRLQSLSLTKI